VQSLFIFFINKINLLKRYSIFILSILIIGCSGEQSDGEPLDIVEVASIQLRFGHDMNVQSSQHKAAVEFANKVAELSSNEITVEVIPNNQLGDDEVMIAMAIKGDLDIILPPTAKLSKMAPEFQVFDLPFLFKNLQQARAVTDNHVGNSLLNSLQKHGLVGVTFWESGFKQFTSQKPLNSLQAFSETHFRIMSSKMLAEQFQSWGAKATQVSFSKTYEALQSGLVEGQENPLSSIVGMGFHKVQKVLTLSDHGYLAQVFAISEKSFSKLSPVQQQWLIQAAIDSTPNQRLEAEQLQAAHLENLREDAIQVMTLDENVKQVLIERTQWLIEKYRPTIGTNLIESMLQFLDQDVDHNSDKFYVVGLDADMIGNSAQSGLSIRRGLELAIEEINAQGGFLGKPVKLVVRDNSMIPARGLKNLEFFKSLNNLIAVVGGISSPVALAELEFIHENDLLYLDPWAAATKIIDNGFEPNNVFRVSVRDEYAGDFLIENALKVSDKIALLLANNPWGRGNFKALSTSLRKRGISPLHVEWFDWGELDIKLKTEELMASKPDVVVYVGNSVEAREFMQEFALLPNKPVVFSHWGITGSTFASLAKDALALIDLRVLQTFSFINNKDDKALQLLARYKQKYFVESAEDIIAPVGTAHAYELMHLLAIAVNQGQSTKLDDIRYQLENITTYNGLVKKYSPPFTKRNHDALTGGDFLMARYINGALVPINHDE
jgi:tripartite ATP-independent transporter DctP family solute receptor